MPKERKQSDDPDRKSRKPGKSRLTNDTEDVPRPIITRNRAPNPSIPPAKACLFLSLPYEIHRHIMTYLFRSRSHPDGRPVTSNSHRAYNFDKGAWDGYGLVNSCCQMKEVAGQDVYCRIEWILPTIEWATQWSRESGSYLSRNDAVFEIANLCAKMPIAFARDLQLVTGGVFEANRFLIGSRHFFRSRSIDSFTAERLDLSLQFAGITDPVSPSHQGGLYITELHKDVLDQLRRCASIWELYRPRALRVRFNFRPEKMFQHHLAARRLRDADWSYMGFIDSRLRMWQEDANKIMGSSERGAASTSWKHTKGTEKEIVVTFQRRDKGGEGGEAGPS